MLHSLDPFCFFSVLFFCWGVRNMESITSLALPFPIPVLLLVFYFRQHVLRGGVVVERGGARCN